MIFLHFRKNIQILIFDIYLRLSACRMLTVLKTRLPVGAFSWKVKCFQKQMLMLQIKVAMTDRYFGECRSQSVGPAYLNVNFFFPHYSTCLYLCVNVKVTWNARFQSASNRKTGSNQSNKHIVQAPFLFTPFLHKAGAMLLSKGYSDMVLSTPPYLLYGDSHESWGLPHSILLDNFRGQPPDVQHG